MSKIIIECSNCGKCTESRFFSCGNNKEISVASA